MPDPDEVPREDAGQQSLEGGCLCGSMRYVLTAPPRVHYCHCSMCRQSTGSAFAVIAWVRWDDVGWHGEKQKTYRSSPIASRSFCGEGGSPLTLQYEDDRGVEPGKRVVHIGTRDYPVIVACKHGMRGGGEGEG